MHSWQDLAFMIGGLVFAPSLIFTIRSTMKPPIKTSLPTALALTLFCVCYATMGFWLALASTGATTICWYILFVQRWRRND